MQQDSGDESGLEEQNHREINAQSEAYENEYMHHRDSSLSTVWSAFQESATAVAQLFRERSSNTYPDTGALWLPFQTAAGTVTKLYKDSCDGVKRTSDAALQCGYQRRTRDLAEWARSKKRRLIRRDDLLAYLAYKPMQPINVSYANRRSPRPDHLCHIAHANNAALSTVTTSTIEPHPISIPLVAHPQLASNVQQQQATQAQHNAPQTELGSITSDLVNATDLHTFKEAIVLRPRGPELLAFVSNELARHCKRSASPIDDKMDVCHYNSKRPRYM